MQIYNTRNYHANGVKVLVYGLSGVGKTTLISTASRPLALSAESGLLSLAHFDVPYIPIKTMADLTDAYNWLNQSAEAGNYDTICLDSVSEIAEVVLSSEKAAAKDARQAYGKLQEVMSQVIRGFRDMTGKHVYFSAKLERQQDETGMIRYYPSMPGNKLAQNLPYFFDEVLCLRVERNPTTNEQMRALQCQPDGMYLAKDRSGRLPHWFEPNLTNLFAAISAQQQAAVS